MPSLTLGGEGGKGEGEGAYPMFLPLVLNRRNVVKNILVCSKQYWGRAQSIVC